MIAETKGYLIMLEMCRDKKIQMLLVLEQYYSSITKSFLILIKNKSIIFQIFNLVLASFLNCVK